MQEPRSGAPGFLISGLSAFSSNGYQWFEVAEVGYDKFHGAQLAELIAC